MVISNCQSLSIWTEFGCIYLFQLILDAWQHSKLASSHFRVSEIAIQNIAPIELGSLQIRPLEVDFVQVCARKYGPRHFAVAQVDLKKLELIATVKHCDAIRGDSGRLLRFIGSAQQY